MAVSKYPSKLSLPQINPGVSSVLAYLIAKFPEISSTTWQQRVIDGKVHWHDGSLISVDTPFQPQQRVYYYREVVNEHVIPFEETIIFQDEHILVANKPPFLPVTAGGIYINECLQNRLRDKTGIDNLQALHRLDRATTGLVLFSVNPETRHLYHLLFEKQKIDKTYHAIAKINTSENVKIENVVGKKWEINNRMVKSTPPFLMKVIKGKANSHSTIRCLQQAKEKALFELHPITGKTHQLRLHMQTLGYPILNDKYYPVLQAKSADDYSRSLQLLAKYLKFIDPVTQRKRYFNSESKLMLS